MPAQARQVQWEASKAGSRMASKQGRGVPVGYAPTPASPECQTAAQESKEAFFKSEKATIVPANSQPLQVAAEQLPHWLPALAGNKPQQSPQHVGLALPQSHQATALPSRTQHRTAQSGSSSSDLDEAHMGFKDMPHPSCSSHTSSPQQVCMLAWGILPAYHCDSDVPLLHDRSRYEYNDCKVPAM